MNAVQKNLPTFGELSSWAKAGMVHSDSGTRAIPERLRGAFTTRRYTNPRLPLPLPHYMIKYDSNRQYSIKIKNSTDPW